MRFFEKQVFGDFKFDKINYYDITKSAEAPLG
jgi:hypothetical protein